MLDDQGDDVSSHADTIRQHFEPGFAEDDKALSALDALLAENQQLRKGIIQSAEQFSMDAADREHQRVHELEDVLADVRAANQRYEKALQRCSTSRSKWVREVAEEALAGDADG